MQKPRVGLIAFFIILTFLILFVRLALVSLIPDPRLLSSPQNKNISISRGSIFDRNGNVLATDTKSYSLYARPSLLSSEVKTFLKHYLSENLFFPDLKQLDTHSKFVWLKRKLTSSEVDEIRYLIKKLRKNHYLENDDIGLASETARFYPFVSAAPVTGTVGMDNQGLQGIEYRFQKELHSGKNITTTIDSDITRISYEELKKAVIENQAEYGSVVIIKTENREILSLVSYPTFDPNHTESFTHYNLINRATGVLFEPGSVMKQFSAALALSKYGITPESPTFFCKGSLKLGEQKIIHEHAHGIVNLGIIIQKSCNIGMIQIANRFSPNSFYDFLTRFGFGQTIPLRTTGIEKGILRPPEQWSGFSRSMIAIGQEIGVTTLQIATAASVIAGNGLYLDPILVSDPPPQNRHSDQVISKDHSIELLQMMKAVVGPNGTAPKAAVEGIFVAGKTGTGQVAKPEGGGYLDDVYNAVFTGYVPADHPKFVVVVVINRPHGKVHTGGEVAAPVFSSIIRRIITSTSYLTK